jgi:hypothetical protein
MFQWLRYSWQTALLAGVGSLLSPYVAAKDMAPPTDSSHVEGVVLMKYENGRLFISENGSSVEPLDLGETPEATQLRNLVRSLSPDGSLVEIPVDRRIVADGGVSAHRRAPAKAQEQPSSKGT